MAARRFHSGERLGDRPRGAGDLRDKRSSLATNVPTPLETRGTNNAVDVSARVIRWTSCLNDALGGVGVAVTSVLTITRMKSCAVKSRVVSSGCESRPATGRSRRKHLGRFKEVTNWTEALQEKAPLGS